MVEFLTTSSIYDRLEQIIKDAGDRLVIVSPYLKVDPRIIEHLEDAANRGVSIRVIHGKRELRENEKNRLQPLSSVQSGMELYFRENLHAKLYMNESKAILTSMNLHEFSQRFNDEMGILVSLETDPVLYRDIEKETERIYNHSKVSPSAFTKAATAQTESRSVSGRTQAVTNPTSGIPKVGFCIRDKASIPANPLKPYCDRCYRSWNRYKDPEYEEKHCHICGKENDSTMVKPLCLPCYRRHKDDFEFAI